jgi:hypothetical protein
MILVVFIAGHADDLDRMTGTLCASPAHDAQGVLFAMETVRLVKFLSESAAELVERADTLGIAESRRRLDEATELLALAARVMARHTAAQEETRRAA